MKCNNKFWLESFKDLFCSSNLAPLPDMSLEEQMNALTRTVFIIFIILLLLDYRYDLLFLFISLIFIIILYYIQKKQMKENYKLPNPKVFTDPNYNAVAYALQYSDTPLQVLPTNSKWRDQEIDLSKDFNDPYYESANQKLAGGPIPRTFVNPIIAPPIADTEYWRPTDFVVPSGINDQKNRELFQSGYAACSETHCTPLAPICATTPISYVCNEEEMGCYKVENDRNYVNVETCNENCHPVPTHLRENYISRVVTDNCIDCCGNMPDKNCKPKIQYTLTSPQPGDMITPMGYNSHQLELHNIPSNLAVGECEKDNAFNCYNKNLYTSIIQPEVYTRNEIIEPIDSNIGISFTQQFEPVTAQPDCNGMTFVAHDPRLVSSKPENKYEFVEEPNESNVYDPRFTGYGTGYRTYIEPMTGQPRFYYDDVDAIRKYNYITRNKIDFTDYGTTSGPMRKKEFTDIKDIRKKAQLTFTNQTINQRTELQERLMRKMNANAWQRKVAPIHTNSMRFTS